MSRQYWIRLGIIVLGLAAFVAIACDDDDDDGGGADTLQEVRDRGTLRCGVNDAVPGFGFLQPDGTFAGFDVDFCRAIAAAVFGDANAVEFIPLTAAARFEALTAGCNACHGAEQVGFFEVRPPQVRVSPVRLERRDSED